MFSDFDVTKHKTALGQPITSLREIIDTPEEKHEYILPDLIPEGETVFVFSEHNTSPEMFAQIISYSVAAGLRLRPFGDTKPSTVLVVYTSRTQINPYEQLRLIYERTQNDEKRELAANNIHILDIGLKTKPDRCLNFSYVQEEINNSIPDECKLVVFIGVAQSLEKGARGDVYYSHLKNLLRKINGRGIASLIFFQPGKKRFEPLENELFNGPRNYQLELTEDPCAPREFGGGCNVFRRKTSELSTSPSYFQFWYTVIEGKLDFGWEIRDNTIKSKQVEIAERQLRVQELLAKDMAQKDIASSLSVSTGTICRDVKEIQSRARGETDKDQEIL